MKTINLFGIKISFNIKKSSSDEVDRYSPTSRLREKILYLILCMFVISISSKVSLLYKSENYRIGDKARKPEVAPKTVTYRDDLEKERIIENMVRGIKREYTYLQNVKDSAMNNFDLFFSDIENMREKRMNSFNYKSWEETLPQKAIAPNLIADLLSLSSVTVNHLFDTSREFLDKAYDSGIYDDKSNIEIANKDYREEFKKFPKIQQDIINLFLLPNYAYNEEKTKSILNQMILQVQDQYTTIKAGEQVVNTGDTIDERKLRALEALGIYSLRKSVFFFIANIVYLVLVSVVFYIMCFSMFKEEILNKKKYRSIFLILIVYFLLYRFLGNNYLYLIPADTALFLIILVTKSKFSLAFIPALLIFALPMTNYNIIYFMIYAVSVPLGYYLLWNVTTRTSIISAGIKLGLLRFVLYVLISLFNLNGNSINPLEIALIIISGLASGTLTVAFLPYFERTFNILTVFKLQELGDLSSPLLERLATEALGTFNHSLAVGTLSEKAAIAIGADPLFARIASYYHDVGKLKRPGFFNENQNKKHNPHDEMSPSMSKMIITSHTKDGVELGRQYRIPEEIRNIMLEHHGTTFLSYFYIAAKSKDPNLLEEEYRYSGPKPRTKESGIIMLADSIEASIKSLPDKTPDKIKVIINEIVSAKINDKQLDDTPLTFKEIEILKASFLSSLVGMHHERKMSLVGTKEKQ